MAEPIGLVLKSSEYQDSFGVSRNLAHTWEVFQDPGKRLPSWEVVK